MTSMPSERPLLQHRLDGWKAIAQYLGRSCRTVQRWHAEHTLPVRHLGGEKGVVFAYNDELDVWMKNRGRYLTDEPPETSRHVLLYAQHVHEELVQQNDLPERSLIPDSAKARSAGLVVLAYKMWEALSFSNLSTIAQLFREAMDLDPTNASAFAGLSFALIAQGIWGLVCALTAYTCANAALQRALEIDAEQPEAKCAAAWLMMVSQRDWQGARRGFDEAEKHHPPTTRAMAGHALLRIAAGCMKEASVILTEVSQQFPLSSSITTWFCWNEYLSGDYANALYQIEQYRASGRHGSIVAAIEALAYIQYEKPNAQIGRLESLATDYRHHDVVRGALGYAYGVAGQVQRAREILDSITHPGRRNDSREPYAVALALIGLNEKQEAVKWLEQSYREGSLWSLGFRSDPILASLRNDPHFLHFMNNISYPEPESFDLHGDSATEFGT